MYGQEVVDQYTILDHDCENNDLLESIGKTKRGHMFMSTGTLLRGPEGRYRTCREPFFTGISGGRKSVCRDWST
jgi:nickel-dependent lactate racemase